MRNMEQAFVNVTFPEVETLQTIPSSSDEAGKDELTAQRGVDNHHDNNKTDPVPFPIAIVGMGMRLPGGVRCAEQFWDLIVNKRDGLCQVPGSRYNVEAFYDESRPGAIRTKHGHFLHEDITQLDNVFFGIGKPEAEKLDPQQRLLLEVVWECMENGGQTDWQGSNIGCYVGVFGEDWLDLLSKDTLQHDRYRVMSAGDFALSNRVSYVYDLRGPSVTLRTGCSSSMVGLHDACQALYAGDCSSALVAGTNLIMGPTMTTTMSENLVVSTSGICKTFDAAADGYGRGEAINVIYIKPLHDALRQGDPIRAIIRSTAVNCDGRTPSITTPGAEAQEQLIRHAYKKAQIVGDEVSRTAFFECHGTGTIVGDTAEASVVANIFGRDGIYIGAVKPNVGHSEGASGITSIIKGVLALENNLIPPNVHFRSPNPKIPFDSAKLRVPVEPTQWPADRRKRVSVNSFGIGGTNAHTILDCASLPSPFETIKLGLHARSNSETHLLVVSAKSKSSLDRRVDAVARYVQDKTPSLPDLAYTLARRRVHLPNRAFALANKDGLVSTFEKSTSTGPRVVFAFTGQGAQWPTMGRDLMAQFPTFREDIRNLDHVLQTLEVAPAWKIEEELSKRDDTSRVGDAEFAQPLTTAIQIALVNLLREWGVLPTLVVGHSSGEIAAAYASGAISASLAIVLSYFRGQSIKAVPPRDGAMAAVGMSPELAKTYLRQGITIACENSPQSVTLSGDKNALDAVLAQIHTDNKDTFIRRLAVNVAYHSHHMTEPAQVYETCILPFMSHNEYMVPLYSTVTTKVICDPSELDAGYWCQNLQSTVLFGPALQRILRDDSSGLLFLEVGPHSALVGPIRQMVQSEQITERTPPYVATLRRGHGRWESLLETAGRLFCHGAPINLSAVVADGKVLTDLPLYPWQHEGRLWSESRLSHDWRFREAPYHELLGCRCLESTSVEPSWRNLLQLDQVPWLTDHRVCKEVVFPCAGYVAMVGEAVHQITGATDFTVKNLFMKTTLTITPSETTEVVTTLRIGKLADNIDSSWYDFTISAFQKDTWKKYCVGHVRPGPTKEHPVLEIPSYCRSVPSDRWYSALEARGLDYGPHFRGLESILASPTDPSATATIPDRGMFHANHYALHPIIIDQSLQLLSVAATNGIPRKLTRLCIPMAIEELYIGTGKGSMSLEMSCQEAGGTLCGNGAVLAENKVVLSLRAGHFFNIQDPDIGRPVLPVASSPSWKPHIDFVPSENQFPPLFVNLTLAEGASRLTLLAILETYHQSRALVADAPHLKKWHSWLKSEYDAICHGGGQAWLTEVKDALALSNHERSEALKNYKCISNNEIEMWICELCKSIIGNVHDMLKGRVEPLDILMEDGKLKSFYQFASAMTPWNKYLELLGHSNPLLRVLEVGGGTGGDTLMALEGLSLGNGNRLYAKYTFTDISPAFLPHAKERFKSYADIEYATLDISQDPTEQGFQPASYDLIIASNVLHATPSISTSLTHVRKLLAPGGRLMLIELTPETPLMDYIMGILPGWWLGEGDGRVGKPYITREQWHQKLLDANFSGVDAALIDNQAPYQLKSHIISQTVPIQCAPKVDAYIYYRGSITEWTRDLESQLTSAGHTVRCNNLQNPPPLGSNVIVLVDVEGPFLHDMTEEDFRSFQMFISNMNSGRILWVTRSVQMHCDDPRFALTLGVVRTSRHEVTRDFATLELDKVDGDAVRPVVRVFEKVILQTDKPTIQRDFEFALQDGLVHVNRFQWSSLDDQLSETSQVDGPRKLDIASYAILDSLAWSCTGFTSTSLGPKDVEIDIKYFALNFRDMMTAMGFIGNKDNIGLEASGIVRRVGSSVTAVSVGDRVMVIDRGLACTRKTIREDQCLPIPDDISLEDAAAVTCVYATVIYSLIYMGNLEEGQSVLIHSACGGVGLAAIQLCQMIGAEIYATVGSEEKVRYLTETMGIPSDHIFNSRNSSFLSGLMTKTNGRGVDLVLNSLSGELLHASWQCVARSGKMLELGKRDFMGHGKLDMDLFSENRSFIGVDLLQVLDDSPSLLHQMAEEMMAYLVSGRIQPIRPIHTYDAESVIKGFRYMQSGQNMGKIVIRMPDDPSTLPVTQLHEMTPYFTDASSYLLVGGLGGLGRAVALWMVEKGARHLIFLSRSDTSSPKRQAFVQDLISQGCSVTAVTGNVANMGDVQRAIAAARKPIAGVVQMSMVLKDQSLRKMSYEEWKAALSPKVQGTWNLHHALKHIPLDFFVLMGSVAGICGWSGQANYGAANTFLDAFVQYRRSQGLVASVIDLGLMEDIGYVNEFSLTDTLARARSSSILMLEESHLLKAMEKAMLSQRFDSPSQLVIGLGVTNAVSDDDLAVMYTQEARCSGWNNILSNVNQTSVISKADELREYMKAIQKAPELLDKPATEQRLTEELGKLIASYTSRPDDMTRDELANIAIDSLMTFEIRTWFRRHAAIELTLLDVSNAGTAGELSKIALRKLRDLLNQGKSEEARSAPSTETPNDNYEKDIEIGAEIRPLPGQAPDWTSESEGRVFLTGATGFLGAFLLEQFVGLPQVKSIACLVRASNPEAGMERLSDACRKFGISTNFRAKVFVVPGDITKDRLGLTRQRFDQLAKWASVVFHFGAYANYTLPYSVHRNSNVLGTLEVLRFANSGRLKTVHHCSSISACGIPEALSGETPEDQRPLLESQKISQTLGYSQSKFVSENIVWNAMDKGFPIVIYRPGIVTGHSITGVCKKEDVFNRLLSHCIRLGCYPRPPDQLAQFVPVDFVCSAIAHISLRSDSIGHAFNVVLPGEGQKITLKTIFDLLSQICPTPLRSMSFPEWADLYLKGGDANIKVVGPVLSDRLAGYRLWWDEMDHISPFSMQNVHRALSDHPEILRVKSMRELLKTYYDYWMHEEKDES
ncbi:polyketide synthase [Aspergillus steynii IBT 23096]|uniref:Polyketide synthase n=1 Tax=Aspergillus steynii IBT 23096 TaxID=1392250 RepID=A0A2I2GMD5_9EURO|nr:polyketide synthase [Aspergillus steynii IBT 23096]PLB54037.1 polyketide synthase [Aspergillus steynii IBT 23096]